MFEMALSGMAGMHSRVQGCCTNARVASHRRARTDVTSAYRSLTLMRCRGTVGEMLTFVGRTVARKTQVGQRQTVQQEEYFCHVYNKDGLVGIAFVDADYPARAGFCVVSKVLEDFQAQRGDSWRGATADTPDQALQLLQDALQKYQVLHR